MVNKTIIAQKSPYPIEVEEGTSNYWCQRGQSKKQPFCDTFYKDTSFRSIVYKASETKKYIFADASSHPINHFVMEHTQKFKNI